MEIINRAGWFISYLYSSRCFSLHIIMASKIQLRECLRVQEVEQRQIKAFCVRDEYNRKDEDLLGCLVALHSTAHKDINTKRATETALRSLMYVRTASQTDITQRQT